MRIRWKIVAVVLPLLVVTIVLVGVSAFFSSTTGITRVTQDFLDFKSRELQKHAESQWRLLVDNGFTNRPDMVSAMQGGIETFAASILRTDTETIFAVDSEGLVVSSTSDVEPTAEETARLKEIFTERDTSLLSIFVAGEERVAKGFYFAPFDWFYLISESRDVFYRDIDRIIQQGIVILVSAITLSFFLLFFFSRQLTRPISAIVASMRKIIQSSDLSERVPVEYKDETGDLAHTFNIMLGELDKAYAQVKNFAFQAVLAQKKETKVRNIFQKYVPQELIDRFFTQPESMLVGENRTLAILFSDIRSFTSISESMRPDDLVNSLNSYFTTMVDIIMERNGIIDKYIGDAIMAFFGAPVAHDNDAYQSVLAGLEMTEKVRDFNRKQLRRGKPEFKIGVGVNYGPVTVGNIGTEKKMDYTVIGDTVNLASRLEGLTKMYRQDLIVAESLFPAIKDTVPWRLLDTVAVKGKAKGVKIYTCKRTATVVERKAWRLNNAAMETYYARDFDGAAEGFDEVLALLPDDPTLQSLSARAKAHRKNPPGEGWDGVEVMTSK